VTPDTISTNMEGIAIATVIRATKAITAKRASRVGMADLLENVVIDLRIGALTEAVRAAAGYLGFADWL
jgi:hypothetical protein